MLFFAGCSSWRLPQNYVYAASHGGHPALDLGISHSQICTVVTLHRWLMTTEECDPWSLDDPSRSHRLMRHAHASVSTGQAELRTRNDDVDDWACIALILFVQRHLG